MEQNVLPGKAERNVTVLHNKDRIQQVLDVEKQAQAIHDAAMREAEQYPKRAEQEAQALVEQARTAAEEEARQLLSKAQSEEESARILAQAQEEVQRMEVIAMSNFDRAVSFVLDRVAGRE
jgi:vacuolar-type H+-ATPase subunit H